MSTASQILINSTEPRVQYTAGAAQTIFTYDFPIFETANLAVFVGSTLQVFSTDYTVTGVGLAAGGTVVFNSGLSAGDIVTIYGDLALGRSSDYQNAPAIVTADLLNDDLDRLAMLEKQLDMRIRRAIRLSLLSQDDGADMLLPTKAARLNKLLGFNAVTGAVEAVTRNADQLSQQVATPNYPATALENAAAVTPTVLSELPGNLFRYGAVGDGVANDTAAVLAAVSIVHPVFVPLGTFLTDDLTLLDDISGPGILKRNTGQAGAFVTTGANGITIAVEIDSNSVAGDGLSVVHANVHVTRECIVRNALNNGIDGRDCDNATIDARVYDATQSHIFVKAVAQDIIGLRIDALCDGISLGITQANGGIKVHGTLESVVGTGISFTAPDTISDTGNGLGIFSIGDKITVTGLTANNKTFEVLTVAAGVITTVEQNITTIGAGPTITIFHPTATVVAPSINGQVLLTQNASMPANAVCVEVFNGVDQPNIDVEVTGGSIGCSISHAPGATARAVARGQHNIGLEIANGSTGAAFIGSSSKGGGGVNPLYNAQVTQSHGCSVAAAGEDATDSCVYFDHADGGFVKGKYLSRAVTRYVRLINAGDIDIHAKFSGSTNQGISIAGPCDDVRIHGGHFADLANFIQGTTTFNRFSISGACRIENTGIFVAGGAIMAGMTISADCVIDTQHFGTGAKHIRVLDYVSQTDPSLIDLSRTGTPEGFITAKISSTCRRDDGGAVTSFYVKESGTGPTGWVAK